MKKKCLAMVLVASMLLLSACGNKQEAPQETPQTDAGDQVEEEQDHVEETQASANEEVYELKISVSQSDQALVTRIYKQLAERLNEKSDGRLKVEVYPSNQLGNDEDVIEQAIQGAAIAVNTDPGRMGTYVNEMGILMMGYFADTYEECLKVTETDIFKGWEDELATQHGIRVLAFNYYDGPRHFMTNKEVRTPEDLKGMRIRTIGSEVCTESVSAMGATPIAMPWSEVYNGIQSNALEGCEVQNTSSYPSKTYEVCKYMSKTGHFQLIQALICGESWFQQLPEDLQQLLMETAKEVGEETSAEVIAEADECEKKMVEAGLIVVEPDLDAFKAAVEPAYEKMGYTELRKELYDLIGKTN